MPRTDSHVERELHRLRNAVHADDVSSVFAQGDGRVLYDNFLKGVAHLTAAIHRRIDSDIPDLCQTLLDRLHPSLGRPFPSMTILEICPKDVRWKKARQLEKGTVVIAESDKEITDPLIARFRTTQPCTLSPLKLVSVGLEDTLAGGARLVLAFRSEIALGKLNLNDLTFYLHGSSSMMIWYYALLASVKGISIVQKGQSSIALTGEAEFMPVGFLPEDSLLPVNDRVFSGFRVLHDSFCFPEKYRFLRLRGLRAVHWGRNTNEFVMHIDVNMPYAELPFVSAENFRLHCVPAINLFETEAEPIHLSHRKVEYPLMANAIPGSCIYEINSVEGVGCASGKRVRYTPLSDLGMEGKGQMCYQWYQRMGEDGRLHTYLSVEDHPLDEPQVLSCGVTAMQEGLAPYFLRHRYHYRVEGAYGDVLSVQGLVAPTPVLLPYDKHRLSDHLLGALTLNLAGLSDVARLRELLSLFDWSRSEAQRREIQALQALTTEPLVEVRRGVVQRGVRVRLQLDDSCFASEREVYQFGLVLHHFLSQYVSAGQFLRTNVLCAVSDKRFEYSEITGRQWPI